MKIGRMSLWVLVFVAVIAVVADRLCAMRFHDGDASERSVHSEVSICTWLDGLRGHENFDDSCNGNMSPKSVTETQVPRLPPVDSWCCMPETSETWTLDNLDDFVDRGEYRKLATILDSLDWYNQENREWVIRQAKNGVAICAFYAVRKEVAECKKFVETINPTAWEQENENFDALDLKLKSLLKHCIFLFLLVEVDIVRCLVASDNALNQSDIYSDIKYKIIAMISENNALTYALDQCFKRWQRYQKPVFFSNLVHSVKKDFSSIQQCPSYKWLLRYHITDNNSEYDFRNLKFDNKISNCENFFVKEIPPYQEIGTTVFNALDSQMFNFSDFLGTLGEFKSLYFFAKILSMSSHSTPMQTPEGPSPRVHGTPPPEIDLVNDGYRFS